jgi:hypothetical protein
MGCYEAKQNDEVIISEYDVEPHFILVFKVLSLLCSLTSTSCFVKENRVFVKGMRKTEILNSILMMLKLEQNFGWKESCM